MIIKIFLPAGTLYQSMYHSMFTFKLQSLLPSSQSGFSWVLTGNYPRFWSWLVVASLGVQERQMFPLVFVSEILSLTFSSRGGGLGNGCFTLSWCIPRGNSEYPTVRAILKLLGSFQQRTNRVRVLGCSRLQVSAKIAQPCLMISVGWVVSLKQSLLRSLPLAPSWRVQDLVPSQVCIHHSVDLHPSSHASEVWLAHFFALSICFNK